MVSTDVFQKEYRNKLSNLVLFKLKDTGLDYEVIYCWEERKGCRILSELTLEKTIEAERELTGAFDLRLEKVDVGDLYEEYITRLQDSDEVLLCIHDTLGDHLHYADICFKCVDQQEAYFLVRFLEEILPKNKIVVEQYMVEETDMRVKMAVLQDYLDSEI